MCEVDFDVGEALVEVFGEVLGGIDATVLAAGTSEGELEVGESTLDVALHMEIGEAVDAVEEGEDFAILFKEVDDGLVESCECLVGFVATGIVGATAVEHITASVAAGIVGDAFLERERPDIDLKRS